jgi:DNA ligase D-like protein (predicted 3'-phosphoesterase)
MAKHESLQPYQKKRNFGKTPEPSGGMASLRQDYPIFVIQKHAASRLHYDFRLESQGVLKSWAVPKGPSLDPREKRLAVETEDHPMDYANFEGVIPEGNYGAGTVMVWDLGPYMNLKGQGSIEEHYQEGQIEIFLYGRKLMGKFALVKMKGRGPKNWLLLKMKDAHASVHPVQAEDRSVLSGKTMEEIAAAGLEK